MNQAENVTLILERGWNWRGKYGSWLLHSVQNLIW